MSIFSDRLKQLRKEKGVTQSDLSLAINKSRVTVTAYETDDRMPDIDTLGKIADYFNEDVDWLIGRTDSRSKKMSDDLPVNAELLKFLYDEGLIVASKNSRNELVLDNKNKQFLVDLFENQKTQQEVSDLCLLRTLDIFGLPLSAKEDLAQAILSIAIKHSAFTPPSAE